MGLGKSVQNIMSAIFGAIVVLTIIAYFLGAISSSASAFPATNSIVGNLTGAIASPIHTILPGVIDVLFIAILLAALIGIYLLYENRKRASGE